MNEKKGKHGKKKWIALGAVAVVLAVLMASTYLWFSSSQEIENVFEMDSFDVRITESFEPTPVVPGAEINKDVGVENKSSVKVAVRMMLKESLQLLEIDADGNPEISYRDKTDLGPKEIMVTVSQSQIDHLIGNTAENIPGSGYVASGITAPTGVELYERVTQQGGGTKTEYFAFETATKRLVEYDADTNAFGYAYYTQKGTPEEGIHGLPTGDLDHTYITIKMGDMSMWKLDPTTGWYYYTKLLDKGEVSKYLVDSVSFSENLDNSYKGAVYTLTPVLSAVQGKNAAVTDVWTDAAGRMSIDDTTETVKFNF